MFRNLFNRGGKNGEVWSENDNQPINKRRKWVIFLIVAAICFLAFDGFGGGEKESEVKTKDEENAVFNIETHAVKEEERLKNIISDVKGAGDVKVMVTFDSMNEKILAKNSKNGLATDLDGEKSKNTTENEENVMVYGSGGEEKPFIIKEKLPVPSGVLVVASGAGSEGVRLEIYEAVKALYGISGHRIKVATKEKADK